MCIEGIPISSHGVVYHYVGRPGIDNWLDILVFLFFLMHGKNVAVTKKSHNITQILFIAHNNKTQTIET